MNKNNSEKKEKKVKIATLFLALAVLFAVYLIAIGALFYGLGLENKITEITARYVPYPAASINYTHWITIRELKENLAASRRFYESQNFGNVGLRVDFSTTEGKKRLKIREKELLNKMAENEIIKILLEENGAEMTSGEINQEFFRKLNETGSWQTTSEKLEKLYGWTLDDFKEKIVKPDLRQKKLMEIFDKNYADNQDKRKKIEKVLEFLSAEKDFAAAARKYSEGLTAPDGGAMGWFRKDQLVSGLAEKVFNLDVGKISSVVETELGYHIVKVDERQKENGDEMIKMSQIFVRKDNFADWLEREMKRFDVKIFLKDYQWNQDGLDVRFADEDLIEFEKKVLEEFQGDASILNY